MAETSDSYIPLRSVGSGRDASAVDVGCTRPIPSRRASAPAISPVELKTARYARISGRQPRLVNWLRKTKRVFKPGAQIVNQGERGGRAFILDQGWTYSSCTLRSGSRQIIDIQIPGDIANLQGLILPFAMQDVTAITRVEVYEVSFDIVGGATGPDPELAAFLLWLVASESAVTSTRLTDLGRRTAIERTAHLILELATRLKLAGLGTDTGFPCPMTQYLIADALGLTPVHVNRVLRELRLSRLASHHRGWLNLLDRDKLVVLAQFDGAYLQHPGSLDC
ncbi:MAG: Crp/Fnr family transcriptional regulator [Hyphomonas sp.]|nr:Crp/Fnr family transcriptional regulator [Hyphomonas sp.]MBU4063450.1 Crp/Fnr family transcriptional regulator [Alphaproteobacteria bacterium]